MRIKHLYYDNLCLLSKVHVKAAVLSTPKSIYQHPLRITEVAQPEPKPGELLCDAPTYTGYTVPGGYAQDAVARTDLVFALPAALNDLHARGPSIMCRNYRLSQSPRRRTEARGTRRAFWLRCVAHLAIAVLQAWKCEVYVASRGASYPKFASSLGATWVGKERDRPPVQLDRAITFAPSGDVVVAALASRRKGGILGINAIHLDRFPQLDYDRLLWVERQIRSVANMMRTDARDFLAVAAENYPDSWHPQSWIILR